MTPTTPRGRRWTVSRWPQNHSGRTRRDTRRGWSREAASRSRKRQASASGSTSPPSASAVGLPTSVATAAQRASHSVTSSRRSALTGVRRRRTGTSRKVAVRGGNVQRRPPECCPSASRPPSWLCSFRFPAVLFGRGAASVIVGGSCQPAAEPLQPWQPRPHSLIYRAWRGGDFDSRPPAVLCRHQPKRHQRCRHHSRTPAAKPRQARNLNPRRSAGEG